MGIDHNRTQLADRLKDPMVGIIGGTGFMGTWLADILRKKDIHVVPVGRTTALTPVQAAKDCDVVVISVPITKTEEIIKEVAPHIAEDKLLMDLTSIKKRPLQAMLRYSRCEVVGVHPLFGLDTSPDEEAKIAICPARGSTGVEWLKKLFTDAGMIVAILSAEKHDQLMGLVQGANHFSTLALALLIKKSGFTLKEIQSCSTQTFMRRLRRITAMLGQSDELFGALLMENNFSCGFVEQYMNMASDLSGIIRNKDGERFRQLFMELKDFFLV